MLLTQQALEQAQSQLGVQEEPRGSNSGPVVNEYLKAAGLRPGFAWCQALVYWCYQKAATLCAAVNPVVKTAGVLYCWNRTSEHRKIPRQDALKNPALLQPGMQFILLFGRATGHTGIVEKVDVKEGTYTTIEGNSNTDGSREGYEVVRHVRKLTDANLQGFINYAV